jgi:hypothetical protein
MEALSSSMQGLFEDAPFLTHVQSGQGLELDLLDMSLQDFISAASPSPSSTSSAQLRKQAPPVPGGLYDPDPKMRGKNALSAKANREKKRAEQEALLARLARFEQLEKAWAAEKAGLMDQMALAQAEVASLKTLLLTQSQWGSLLTVLTQSDKDCAEPASGSSGKRPAADAGADAPPAKRQRRLTTAAAPAASSVGAPGSVIVPLHINLVLHAA